MRSALRSWAAFLAVLALSVPVAAVDDDLGGLPGDDLSAQLAAGPIDWRPVITHFYVQSRTPSADPAPLHFEATAGGLPELSEAWEQLKPHVRVRRDEHSGQSFREDEPVISGWRTTPKGNRFELHAGVVVPPPEPDDGIGTGASASAEKRPIQALLASQELTVFVGIEIPMSIADPEKRDELLRDFFELDRFRLSIHLIDEDIEGFRGNPNEEPFRNARTGMGGDRGVFGGSRWHEVDYKLQGYKWYQHLRVGGAYAIRVNAWVSGRTDGFEDPSRKEVEGEIRVVLVDQTIEIDQLSFEEMGETDTLPNIFNYQ